MTILGYALTEWKIMYYRPNLVHKSWHPYIKVSDDFYDKAEAHYNHLCKKFGEEPVATLVTEIDLNRPSVQMAISKLSVQKTSETHPVLSISEARKVLVKTS